MEGSAARDEEPTGAPVFIIGTERSGSNLLRLILNSHSALAVPHPPHILRYFTPLLPYYGDLSRDECFGRLVRDVLRLVRFHICPWEIILDVEDVIEAASPRSLLGIQAACYESYARGVGKRRWGCKSTFVIDHADEVLNRFSAARLVYLVRDPRDVVVSSKRAVFNPYHPYFTARLWQEQQDTGAALLDRLPPGTIRLLRYEDLLRDPEGVLRTLCDFIGEDWEPGVLRFFETPEARRCSSLSQSWVRTASPLQTGNSGRYRRELSPRQRALVEGICSRGMDRFGYETESVDEAHPGLDPGRARRYYRWADLGMSLRAEARSLLQDRNHWRRWARAALLVWLGFRLQIGSFLRSGIHAHDVSRSRGRGS